jgi:hypothetical protein
MECKAKNEMEHKIKDKIVRTKWKCKGKSKMG